MVGIAGQDHRMAIIGRMETNMIRLLFVLFLMFPGVSLAGQSPIVGLMGMYASAGGAFDISALFTNNEAGAWYDANDLTTLFQDTAGTTAVTTAGQSVRRMNDKSGNDHDITFSGATPPILFVDANGNYALAVNGSTTARGVNSTLSTGSTTTVLMVADQPATGSNRVSWDTYTATANAGIMFYYNGTTSQFCTGGGSVCLSHSWYSNKHIYTGVFNDTSSKLVTDGFEVTTGTVTINGFNGFSLFDIRGNPTPIVGGYYDTVSKFYGMVIVDGVLSDELITSTTSALSDEFNIGIGDTVGFFLGDSTMAAFSGSYPTTDYIDSVSKKLALAVPNETTVQQMNRFIADVRNQDADYIVMQLGLNDLNPAESAATAIARLQDLVDNARSYSSVATKIFISQMTPCRSRLISVYGPVDGVTAYNKWVSMNEAIAGNGGTPITGVDGRITSHATSMNDGSGNLLGTYDSGDGIHPNNAGRAENAAAISAALSAAGVL